MIDLFESVIKMHTIVILAEYFKRNQLSDTAKGLLAVGLRTPSLGTWQLFSRELFKELKTAEHPFIFPAFPKEFETLDKALNNEKTNVISFRNGYAHGATPSEEDCIKDIKQYEPFLELLLASKWLNESKMIEKNGVAFLAALDSSVDLSLHPLLIVKQEENLQPYAFFNDLKNDKVGLLNYPLSKHYKEKEFFAEFHNYLPLQEWKKTGSNEFNNRIEELTETFKGRTQEREDILNFALTKSKGYLSIQGNPGIGKSALIAQIFIDLTNDELKLPIHLVAYFVRRGTAQADSLFLLNYLLKHTDIIFPEGRDIKAEGKTNWDLQQQLFNKWRAYGESEPAKKIIFLIDGLDEGIENEILRYLPRENFNNILVIYGSRPGGHKDLEAFWSELPIEHHTVLPLSGLNKNDIRALLYEVTNKYEIEKDSSWIDIVQKRSEGNPLYLKLLCNALENGSIEINDPKALPREIDDYYKAILDRYANNLNDGDALLDSLYVLASALDYLTPAHLRIINGFGEAQTQRVESTLKEVLYENPLTEEVLDYQLFHESFREYLVKNKAAALNKAESKILAFCSNWQEQANTWEQSYALKHYSTHLCNTYTVENSDILIALGNTKVYTDTQKKVLRSFDATKKLFKNTLTTCIENKSNEAAINAALALVDIKYEEQNDASNIIVMVANNEIELALQRITSFGGPTKEEKQRQFILFMLCLMELTLLDSKEKAWSKLAIEKLLAHFEEQIPIDYSINWDDFFPSYLIFLVAVEIKNLGINYLELYKRTDNWKSNWIKEKGPYTSIQIEILFTTAQVMSDESAKSSAFMDISMALANQGKLDLAEHAMQQAIATAQNINNECFKSNAFKDISMTLSNQGKIDQAEQAMQQAIATAQVIRDESEKSNAFEDISVTLAKQGNFQLAIVTAQDISDKSYIISVFKDLEVFKALANQNWELAIATAQNINNECYKSNAFKDISMALSNQGKIDQAEQAMQQAITTAQVISDEWYKSNAFKDISVALANQGNFQLAIATAKVISHERAKSNTFKDISVALANQGKIDQAEHAMQQAIASAQGISNERPKSNAFKDISVALANQGKIDQAEHAMQQAIITAQCISNEWAKGIAFRDISVALAKQGNFQLAIATTQAINSDFDKYKSFQEISVILANQGNFELAIATAQGINRDFNKDKTFRDISVALSNQGKIDQAKQAMQQALVTVHGINEKNYSLAVISHALANQGNFELAIAIAQSISDVIHKSSAFKSISVILANQGNFELAISIAQGISNNFYKSPAFRAISVALAKQGNFQLAIATAQGISNERHKSEAFRDISMALSNQGKLDQAKQAMQQAIATAQGISDERDKSSAFESISVILANQGNFELAISTAQGISDERDKSSAFESISVILANEGNFELAEHAMQQAIATAQGISDENNKCFAFENISVALANQGKIDLAEKAMQQAIATAQGISDERHKSNAFKDISVALANQGNFQLAIVTAQSISRERDKGSAFKSISKTLAAKGNYELSFEIINKIELTNLRSEFWQELGKNEYEEKNLNYCIAQLQTIINEEAKLFYKKGIISFINTTNATVETITSLLNLIKEDTESIEHLLQNYALNAVFFTVIAPEKLQVLNKTLNIQWALDVIAKFPTKEIPKSSSNVQDWINQIKDEDDQEEILLNAKKVAKGKISEEEFLEKLQEFLA
jgi:hypothetical protein